MNMKSLDKLFINHGLFKIITIVATFCFFANAAIVLVFNPAKNIFNATMTICLGIIMLTLMYCSQKYMDNTVKGLVGLLLGMIFAYDLRFFDKNHVWFSKTQLVFGIIKLVIDIALVVFYLSARNNSNGNSKAIRFCQVAFLLLAVVTVLNNIPYFIDDFPEENHFWFIQDILETLSFIFSYFSVVCVVCAVDKYKMLRNYFGEKGEWTQALRMKTKEELFGNK